ncbi:MAG: hypothetical protein WC859_01065 [Elusimicrobiota bacterium]|jgi:hypothetical protein
MTRSRIIAAVGFFLFLYVLLSFPYLHNLPRADEIDFLYFRTAIIDTGFPIIPTGSSNELFLTGQGSWNNQWGADIGLWHPPFYLYLISLLTGTRSAWGARVLGQACFMISLLLCVFWLRQRAKKKAPSTPWAPQVLTLSALAALNPYWLRGSLLIDIDTSIMTLAGVGLLGLMTWLLDNWRFQRSLVLIVYLSICLWIKETTLVWFAGIGLAFLFHREWRIFRQWCFLVIAGVILFMMTWWLYTKAMGVPWDFMLGLHAQSTKFQEAASLYERISAVRWYAAWMSIPVFVLYLYSLIRRTFTAPLRDRSLADDLPLFIGATGFILYTLCIPTVDKYLVPFMPFLLLTIVQSLDFSVPASGIKRMALLFLAALALTFWLAPDIVVIPSLQQQLTTHSFRGCLTDIRFVRYLKAIADFVIILVLGLRVLTGSIRSRITLGLVVAALAANLVELSVLKRYPYTLLNPKDDPGYTETIDFLNHHLTGTEGIASYKDIGYNTRSHARTLPLDREISVALRENGGVPVTLVPDGLSSRNPIRYVVLQTQDVKAWGTLKKFIHGPMRPYQRFGAYDILKVD